MRKAESASCRVDVSRVAIPSSAQSSRTIRRVMPSIAPLESVGVHTVWLSIQNRLLAVASVVSSRVLSKMASSAPAASASERARMYWSLLLVLNEESGVPANSRWVEVMTRTPVVE